MEIAQISLEGFHPARGQLLVGPLQPVALAATRIDRANGVQSRRQFRQPPGGFDTQRILVPSAEAAHAEHLRDPRIAHRAPKRGRPLRVGSGQDGIEQANAGQLRGHGVNMRVDDHAENL